MRTLVILLLLALPAQATTYSFSTNQTTTVYVGGNIAAPVGVMFNLTPLAPTAPCLTSCDFGIWGNATIENGNWLYGDLSVSIGIHSIPCGFSAFGGVLCPSMYVPGRFLLDDDHRLLTISSQIGWLDTYPESIDPRIVFDLPDGLTLHGLGFAEAETPLPAAWLLFATGLVLLWRKI